MSKSVSFQIIQFSIKTQFKLSQTLQIQIIQFTVSTDFIYTQLNVKTVQY